MRTMSNLIAETFRDIVARVGASFRAQREIEARRVLHRYRQLLEQPRELRTSSEVIPVCNQEDIPANANGTDAHPHVAARRTLERA